MSRATIYEILDRIRQLPEEDRLLFDELLAQQEDQEWRGEAANVERGSREKFEAALASLPDTDPEEYDKL